MPTSGASNQANQAGIASLSTILKRLEAATSRLEDVAMASTGLPLISSSSAAAIQDSLSEQLPNTSRSTGAPTSTAGVAGGTGSSRAVQAYQQDIIDGALADYIAKSKDAAPLVGAQAELLAKLCKTQLSFLELVSQCKKPASPEALMKLLGPTQADLKAVMDFKDTNSRSKEGRTWGNHLTAVAEGVAAWGWVTVEPAPAPFVGSMKDSAQFYSNRVIKEFKETDPKQVAWAKSLIATIEALQAYVKQYHMTGLAWNPRGADPAQVPPPTAAASASAAPPKPDVPAKAAPAGGFLAQLNQGSAVTSGLKKVSASEQTHKNPALRASSVVSETSAKPAVAPKPAAAAAKKPPRTELVGTKWEIDFHEGNSEIVIDKTEINQTVHIFGCKNSVIQIKGKVNAISMLSCSKTSVLLDSVVSQLSITSSPSFTVQILGLVPTILIDTTDSGQVYLSKECVTSSEIITSKTSSINISLPTAEEGDFVERAVPEQMKTVVENGKLVTTIVEHAG